MKKLLAMTMVLVLVLSLTSVASFTASADTLTEGDYEYELIDDGSAVKITKYIGVGGDVTIPFTVASKPVKEIGDEAFFSIVSAGLTSVVLPNSITDIGEGAFWGCTSLTSIIIPSSVTSIDEGAFKSCLSLTTITVESGNPVYHSDGNCLIETASKTLIAGCQTSVIPSNGSVIRIGNQAFFNCLLTSVTIPNGVTDIGDYAFYACYNLTNIKLSNNVTRIGEYAFYDCDSLTSILIPNSVTNIGNYAFYMCDSLTNVAIPNSVTTIGCLAFELCLSLTSVTIPSSVTSIGDEAFSGCTSLTSIAVENDNPVYHSTGNCLIETESKALIAACPNSEIPTDGSVTSIGSFVFAWFNIPRINIPDGVTSIGVGAFWCCRTLTNITIPKSVTTIGDMAFYGCEHLETVYYEGTQTDRDNMMIESGNDALLNATWVYEYQPPEELSDPPDVSADREPGDANGDGGLDMKDVLLVRKAIAGLSGTINETAADVNRDGSVDMKDVLLMRKFIAGLIETLA